MKGEPLQNILDRLADKRWAVFSKHQLDDVIGIVQDDFYYRWNMTGGGGWSVFFEITGVVE